MPRAISRSSSSALPSSSATSSQLRGLRVGPGAHRRARAGAEAQGEGDQPLLGAVVQVAFDAAAGGVGGGDDPGAGGGELGVELGVVQGDGELAGDERDRVEPLGGERAAEESVLQQQHRPQRAAAEDRHGQQRAAAGVGEVGVAGEAVVVGGVGDDAAARRCAGRSAAPTAGRWLVAGADRAAAPAGAGSSQSLAVVVPQQQVHGGGAGQRAEHLDHAGVQPLQAGLASSAPGRRTGCRAGRCVPVVTVARWCAAIGGSAAAPVLRVGARSQGRVGPVELGDLRGRAPGGVVLAGLGEQGVAGVVEAVAEVEAGRAFGDQRPVPRPSAAGDLVPGGVEGEGGGAEVADRPGPLGLEQPHAGAGSCSGASAARAASHRDHLVQLGQQLGALVGARPVRACPARASPRSRRATAAG